MRKLQKNVYCLRYLQSCATQMNTKRIFLLIFSYIINTKMTDAMKINCAPFAKTWFFVIYTAFVF